MSDLKGATPAIDGSLYTGADRDHTAVAQEMIAAMDAHLEAKRAGTPDALAIVADDSRWLFPDAREYLGTQWTCRRTNRDARIADVVPGPPSRSARLSAHDGTRLLDRRR
jgi:hypothetical protein